MKKITTILVAILVVCALALVLTACNTPCPDGEHEWGEWAETTAATCTDAGVATRVCQKCNEKDTQPIDALGHVVEKVDGTPATCVDDGYTDGTKCSRCNVTLTEQQVIAARHVSQVVYAKAATCTEAGYESGHKCAICGVILDGLTVINPSGHDEKPVSESEATCTAPAYTAGTQCTVCGEYLSGHEAVGEPNGHDFSAGSYFTLTLCGNNCGTYGSKTGGAPFETEFIFDFDEDVQETIDILWNDIQAALANNSSVSYDDFVELFNEFDEYVGYMQAQYQFAQILNDIEYSNESRETFAVVADYYYETIARYYTLFKDIDNSRFKVEFWEDTEWEEDYIQYVLSLADSYDVDNRNAVDDILDEYEDLMMGNLTAKKRLTLNELYSRLVEANNNIATSYGYDNYMEYAYKEIYERDYSPSDVSAMRNYVRTYIGPLLADIAGAYEAWENAYVKRGGWSSRAAQLYYSQYVGNWMWGDANYYIDDSERLGMILNSRDSIAEYFAFLDKSSQQVSFTGAVENLFETGNFFMGANTNITAYTWYIYSTDTPILVFGGDEDYQGTFTFIHEFGHYYQFVYNELLGISMDQDETQSQGNEMLFLAWLKANMPQDVYEGFEILELEQLLNMLGSVVMSTAVDEFEYLAYTGATEFNGKAIATVTVNGKKVIDYGKLYQSILKTYWKNIDDWFNTDYWMVSFDSTAYYISYAMSALPCIELYAKAGNDGLEEARESYLKLFTFSQNDAFIETDSFDDRYVTATYQEVLNWAGLQGPFQEGLYQSIQQYFESRN